MAFFCKASIVGQASEAVPVDANTRGLIAVMAQKQPDNPECFTAIFFTPPAAMPILPAACCRGAIVETIALQ
jgi:hypothetical protein